MESFVIYNVETFPLLISTRLSHFTSGLYGSIDMYQPGISSLKSMEADSWVNLTVGGDDFKSYPCF